MPLTRLAAAVVLAVLTSACAEGARPELAEPDTTSTMTTGAAPTPTTLPPAATTTEAPFSQPAAPNGRQYPAVPAASDAAAARVHEVEQLLRSTDVSDPAFADLAHEQQMLYRVIGRDDEWTRLTIAEAPEEIARAVIANLAARQSIADISHGGDAPVNAPAWEIIEPLPADELRDLYEAAAADTGIHWSFLAAINMIETGFGRIDGLSTAGAQGPMQFLPTTWEEVSDGDINDPHDAIPAAARYLVRRGGPNDMQRALWGYNNSDAYVAAVTQYANLFREDERAFIAAHSWEIHFSAAAGDLWFPVGYRVEEAIPVEDYLRDAPWSAPPPRS